MSEHLSREPVPELIPQLEGYRKFDESIAAVKLLIERGYAQDVTLTQIKQEIEFELKLRRELRSLPPELSDKLLDALHAVNLLLSTIENSRQ